MRKVMCATVNYALEDIVETHRCDVFLTSLWNRESSQMNRSTKEQTEFLLMFCTSHSGYGVFNKFSSTLKFRSNIFYKADLADMYSVISLTANTSLAK